MHSFPGYYDKHENYCCVYEFLQILWNNLSLSQSFKKRKFSGTNSVLLIEVGTLKDIIVSTKTKGN